MQATWDVSGKACQIELVYTANTIVGTLTGITTAASSVASDLLRVGAVLFGIPGLPALAGGAPVGGVVAPAGGATPKNDPLALVHIGPDQLSIGAGWPDFLRNTGQADAVLVLGGGDPVEGSTFRDSIAKIAPFYRLVEAVPNDLFPRNLLREHPLGVLTAGAFRVTSMPYRAVGLIGGAVRTTSAPISKTASPTLPDDGRIVTTGEKTHPIVQPPRPILDGATRTSMVTLFAAILQTPCFLPDAAPITSTPLYSPGLFVHAPGVGATYDTVGNLVNTTRGQFTVVAGRDELAGSPSNIFPDNKDGLPDHPDFRG